MTKPNVTDWERCYVFKNKKGEKCYVSKFTSWWLERLSEWKSFAQNQQFLNQSEAKLNKEHVSNDSFYSYNSKPKSKSSDEQCKLKKHKKTPLCKEKRRSKYFSTLVHHHRNKL